MKTKDKAHQTIDFLNNGQFHGDVMFLYGMNYDEIIASIKKLSKGKNPIDPDWLMGINSEEDRRVITEAHACALKREKVVDDVVVKTMFYIVIKDKFKFTPDDYITLSHEVVHQCQFYLPYLLNRDVEIEAEAYYHSHIMRQCLRIMKEANKTNKTSKKIL